MKRGQPAPGQYQLWDETMPLRKAESVDALPDTARQLVDVMGLQAAVDLVKSPLAGKDFVVPSVVAGSSRYWDILVESVGVEAATKLVKAKAGEHLYVPQCYATLLAIRDAEIKDRYYTQGQSVAEIREELGRSRRRLTERRIYQILGR